MYYVILKLTVPVYENMQISINLFLTNYKADTYVYTMWYETLVRTNGRKLRRRTLGVFGVLRSIRRGISPFCPDQNRFIVSEFISA